MSVHLRHERFLAALANPKKRTIFNREQSWKLIDAGKRREDVGRTSYVDRTTHYRALAG
jgi:hypothetical protein